MLGSSRTAVWGQAPVSTPDDTFLEQNSLEGPPDVFGVLARHHVVFNDEHLDTESEQLRCGGFHDGSLARAYGFFDIRHSYQSQFMTSGRAFVWVAAGISLYRRIAPHVGQTSSSGPLVGRLDRPIEVIEDLLRLDMADFH